MRFRFLQKYQLFSLEPNPRDIIETKRNRQTLNLKANKQVSWNNRRWVQAPAKAAEHQRQDIERGQFGGGGSVFLFFLTHWCAWTITCSTEYRNSNQLSLCWGQQDNIRAISELRLGGISRQWSLLPLSLFYIKNQEIITKSDSPWKQLPGGGTDLNAQDCPPEAWWLQPRLIRGGSS